MTTQAAFDLGEQPRKLLLQILDNYGLLEPATARMLEGLALGSLDGLMPDIRSRFGAGAEWKVLQGVENPTPGGVMLHPPPDFHIWLWKVPDFYIQRLIDAALALAAPRAPWSTRHAESSAPALKERLNTLLATAGGTYRINDELCCVLADEPLLTETVVAPALSVLGSRQYTAVLGDLEDSLAALGSGTAEGFERACVKASAAVEGTLAVIMDRHRIPAKKSAVHPRFIALRDAGHIANHFEPLITAASVIRNQEAGHSSHTAAARATAASARAAVHSACAAILYLTTLA